MELSPRKRAVLAAVAKAYIKTGEPVGSKTLAAMLKNAPSSATLRSEMSELCELGLLAQPHTSAGRVPTSRGLKTYVDSLMSPDKISEGDKAFIDRGLSNIHAAPEKIPEIGGELLHRLTGLPAIACFFTDEASKVRRVQLVPVSRSSVLLLLITADGRTRSRVFRPGREYDRGLDEKFSGIISRRIAGMPVGGLTKAYMQSVTAEAGIDSLRLMPLMSAVFELAEDIKSSGVTLLGESAFYNICGSEDEARRIISLINMREPAAELLSGIKGGAGVIFGSETGYNDLKSVTVTAAKFSGRGRYGGAVGVIGPDRISYERIIPVVEYTALRLSDLISEAQKDMEE